MLHPRPGWMVALSAAVLAVSAWLPWLTTPAGGGGRANAAGGTRGSLALPEHFGAGQMIVLLASVLLVAGAMIARGISARRAAVAALVISVATVGLIAWYHHRHVGDSVSASYGWYLGATAAAAATGCAFWAVVDALRSGRSVR